MPKSSASSFTECFLEEQLPPLPIAIVHLKHSFNQHVSDGSRLTLCRHHLLSGVLLIQLDAHNGMARVGILCSIRIITNCPIRWLFSVSNEKVF